MTRRRPPIPQWDDLPAAIPDIRSRLEALSSPPPPPALSGAPSGRGAAVRAGQAAARARGVRIGRPRSYDDRLAGEVRAAAADGTSLRGLAALYGLSLGAVQRILATP